jgi:CBS domain-containing protein
MKAKDVMTTAPMSISLSTPVDRIAKLLTTNRISGLPVVDEDDRVLGIVTETDVSLKEKVVPFSTVKAPALFGEWTDAHRIEESYRREAHLHTAADVMTQKVICVDVNDEVSHVSEVMMRHGIGRVPVLRDGRLAGIITRSDLIRNLSRS